MVKLIYSRNLYFDLQLNFTFWFTVESYILFTVDIYILIYSGNLHFDLQWKFTFWYTVEIYILIYSGNLHFDLARRRLCYLEDSCGTQFPRGGQPYKCFYLHFFYSFLLFRCASISWIEVVSNWGTELPIPFFGKRLAHLWTLFGLFSLTTLSVH